MKFHGYYAGAWRDESVMRIGYELDNKGTGVQFLAGEKHSPLLQSISTDSGAHSASLSSLPSEGRSCLCKKETQRHTEINVYQCVICIMMNEVLMIQQNADNTVMIDMLILILIMNSKYQF